MKIVSDSQKNPVRRVLGKATFFSSRRLSSESLLSSMLLERDDSQIRVC